VDFTTATDRALGACITLEDIANEAGVSHGLMRQARLDPSSGSYRNPPASWEAAVARLARKRAAELAKLADALERGV
jgi:hypothetical protein